MLPAIGVGAAVYIVTGWITLPTLGLVWKPSFIGKMAGETLGMVGKWLGKPLGWWENGVVTYMNDHLVDFLWMVFM